LPVDYYHVVFTLPAPISDIAYQNKAVIYNLLFKAANHTRVRQVQRLRELISDDSIAPAMDVVENSLPTATYTCQDCGAAMIIIETFARQKPRAPPASIPRFPPLSII